MNRMGFTEEMILAVLNEAESGGKVQSVCRKYGISDTTFYKWRSKYSREKISEAKKIRQLEEENQRLKSIVADLTLRNQALKRVVSKKWD